jgi:hypothetical protein
MSELVEDDPDSTGDPGLDRLAREGGARIISIAAAQKRKLKAEAKRKAEEEAKLPTRFTAKQLLELELPPQKFLVDGLIPVGMTVLASPPKIGKTWLNLQLAVAVATGQRFADFAECQFGKVLFLDLEGGQRREKFRLQKVLGHNPANDQLHIAFDWPRMGSGGLELLDRYIREEGYVLVIIDIWNKFRRPKPRGADHYEFDSAVGHEVSSLARQHDMSIIVTHHTKKGSVEDHLESISGSNGLPGAADTNVVITRKRGTGQAMIQITPRDAREHSLAVEFNEGLWRILGDADEVHGTARRQAIHGLLSARGAWMSPREIAEELEEHDVRNVRRTLRKMRADRAVEQDAKGRYRIKDASKLV